MMFVVPPKLVTPVVFKLVVFTLVKATLSAVAISMPPAAGVSLMFLPVRKLAVLFDLVMVLTVVPSICVTTSCRAPSILSLVVWLKSTE